MFLVAAIFICALAIWAITSHKKTVKGVPKPTPKEVVPEPTKPEPKKEVKKVWRTKKSMVLYIEKKWNVYQLEEYLRSKGIPYKARRKDEGRIHDGKYDVPVHTTVREIIKAMRARFQIHNGDVNKKTLIMASLVEKEMVAHSEAPIIAGVFFNRIKKGMKLQTDPTAIYGHYREVMKRKHRRPLRKDIRRPGKYNTYKIKGLPPGPICTPTKVAIDAVRVPQKHDYLFFVAKGDGKHHYFSKTHKEHMAYTKKLREKKGRK